MTARWWRRAIQRRLELAAGAALILWIGATTMAASIATTRIERDLTAERRARAARIAERLEEALEQDLRQLDRVAAAFTRSSADVGEGCRGLRLAHAVLRVGRDGRVLWARGVRDGAEIVPAIARLSSPADGHWHARPTRVVETGEGARVFLVLPARESDPLAGALAASIDPRAGELASLLRRYADEPYRVVLRDDEGREIAASRAEVPGGPLLSAAARVARGPWAVHLEQPRSAALGPVLALRRILVGSSLLSLAFALVVAWGAARSIRQPVLAMTAAAERLVTGRLLEPIPPAGEDEIGRLAVALETLRKALEGDERRSLLLKRVITAQEDERRRIARELHDETTQQLTALALQLDTQAQAHPATAASLAGARALVGRMIDDVHRLIHGLRPSMLDDLGLLPAIRWYAETHLATKGIEVHCEFPDVMPDLSQDARTALYRVVQEALTNIARHSRAECVLIACVATSRALTIEIEDDGIGFEPEQVRHPRESGEGLGLLGMRERLALLGGTCTVEAEPGGGTRVAVTLPLAAGPSVNREPDQATRAPGAGTPS